MKQRNKRHIRSSAVAVGMAALLSATPMAAQACNDEPYIDRGFRLVPPGVLAC